MALPSEVDIVIVGAGAAGIAAGRRLMGGKFNFVILEARLRAGGRAWTVTDRAPYPIDLGCGWLHSADRNAWTQIAEAEGLTVDRSPPPWEKPAIENGFSAAAQKEFGGAVDAFYARLDAASGEGRDRALSDFLPRDGKWNARLDAISSYVNGVELDRASLQEYSRYEDSETNWRIAEGYGAAIAKYAAGLPIVLDCAAGAIDHSGKRLCIRTPRGEIYARAALITISSALIAEDAIRFIPGLPGKAAAASMLPLGLANKVFVSFEAGEVFPKDCRLYGKVHPAGAAAYHLNPFGRPLIEAYFGGKLACELEAAGEKAFGDFVMEELAALLGSGARSKLKFVAASGWAADPYARGSYSYALPGHADDRMILAAPVDGRLFFAGEACSRSSFSTAHGAYETGIAAADLLRQSLG